MFDIPAFRLIYDEFSDNAKYPDDIIIYWSGLAAAYISEQIYGTYYNYAWDLLTAHSLVFWVKNQSQAAAGGIPGGNAGAISSKQAGSLSVSYDAMLSSEDGAGMFNQTTYGRQYVNMSKLLSPRGYQL